MWLQQNGPWISRGGGASVRDGERMLECQIRLTVGINTSESQVGTSPILQKPNISCQGWLMLSPGHLVVSKGGTHPESTTRVIHPSESVGDHGSEDVKDKRTGP